MGSDTNAKLGDPTHQAKTVHRGSATIRRQIAPIPWSPAAATPAARPRSCRRPRCPALFAVAEPSGYGLSHRIAEVPGKAPLEVQPVGGPARRVLGRLLLVRGPQRIESTQVIAQPGLLIGCRVGEPPAATRCGSCGSCGRHSTLPPRARALWLKTALKLPQLPHLRHGDPLRPTPDRRATGPPRPGRGVSGGPGGRRIAVTRGADRSDRTIPGRPRTSDLGSTARSG
jgi:hypothetical protein